MGSIQCQSESKMNKRRKKGALFALKIVIAAGLLGWLLSKVHWSDYVVQSGTGRSYSVVWAWPSRDDPQIVTVSTGIFGQGGTLQMPSEQLDAPSDGGVIRPGFATTLTRMDRMLFAFAVAGFALSAVVVGVRWWLLLVLQSIKVRLWEAIRLTFLGQFFNSVVPGTVGGDVIKAYYVARHTPRKAGVVLSIFVDRVLGLAEMVLLAGVMLAIVIFGGLEQPAMLRSAAIMVAIVTCLVIFLLAMILSRRFRKALRLDKLYSRLPLSHHIEAAGYAARIYRRRVGGLARAVIITLGAQIIWMSSIAMLGMSLHIATPPHTYFIFVPVIYIIGALPLTPGGMGVVEAGYVEFFSSAQCGPSTVLVLAMLARLVPMLISLPGLVVAVTGPKLPPADRIQAELGLNDTPQPPMAETD